MKKGGVGGQRGEGRERGEIPQGKVDEELMTGLLTMLKATAPVNC